MASIILCDRCSSGIKPSHRAFKLRILIGNGYNFGCDLCDTCRNLVVDFIGGKTNG